MGGGGKNEEQSNGKVRIRKAAEFLAVGEACKGIFWALKIVPLLTLLRLQYLTACELCSNIGRLNNIWNKGLARI